MPCTSWSTAITRSLRRCYSRPCGWPLPRLLYNHGDAAATAVSRKSAGVLGEAVQGEGGVRVATPAFVKACRDITRERGALLIFDEVQTGIGRTGRLFAYEHFGVAPDIMTLAKGLECGIPIGACLATDEVAPASTPGSQGAPLAGNRWPWPPPVA